VPGHSFPELRPLVVIVTSYDRPFDHADYLGLRVCSDGLWFPPLIETLIAITIVAMAIENIVYAALGKCSAFKSLDRRLRVRQSG
jgi:hypothetical protein